MSQPEGKRSKMEESPKVLTDFGELERLPADTRAVLLSNMDDIRQLIEFGRSNPVRRRFLKRHRVFPMWFKRQCGFPANMSDQEVNASITNLLARFDYDYAKIGWEYSFSLEFRYSAMTLHGKGELCERIVQSTYLPWKKDDRGLYVYDHKAPGNAFFHFFKVVQVIDRLLPNAKVPLRLSAVNFDCTQPVDVVSISHFLFFVNQLLDMRITRLTRPHRVSSLIWALESWGDQEDDNFCEHTFRVLTQLFREGKIKLSEL